MSITTIQSGIKHHTQDSLTNYALFMGGTNVTHDVLQNLTSLNTLLNMVIHLFRVSMM